MKTLSHTLFSRTFSGFNESPASEGWLPVNTLPIAGEYRSGVAPTPAIHDSTPSSAVLNAHYLKGAQHLVSKNGTPPRARSNWALAPQKVHYNVSTEDPATQYGILRVDPSTSKTADNHDSEYPDFPDYLFEKPVDPAYGLDATLQTLQNSDNPSTPKKASKKATKATQKSQAFSQPGQGVGIPHTWLEPKLLRYSQLLITYICYRLANSTTGILHPFTIPATVNDLNVSEAIVETQLKALKAAKLVHHDYKNKRLICAVSPSHLCALLQRLSEAPSGYRSMPSIFWNPLTHKDVDRAFRIAKHIRTIAPYQNHSSPSDFIHNTRVDLQKLISEDATFHNARQQILHTVNDGNGVPEHKLAHWYQAIPVTPHTQHLFGVDRDNSVPCQLPNSMNPHPGPDFAYDVLKRPPIACYSYVPMLHMCLILATRPEDPDYNRESYISGKGLLSPFTRTILLLLILNADIRTGKLEKTLSQQKICFQLGLSASNHHRVSEALKMLEYIGILHIDRRTCLYQCDAYTLIPHNPTTLTHRNSWDSFIAALYTSEAARINEEARDNPKHQRYRMSKKYATPISSTPDTHVSLTPSSDTVNINPAAPDISLETTASSLPLSGDPSTPTELPTVCEVAPAPVLSLSPSVSQEPVKVPFATPVSACATKATPHLPVRSTTTEEPPPYFFEIPLDCYEQDFACADAQDFDIYDCVPAQLRSSTQAPTTTLFAFAAESVPPLSAKPPLPLDTYLKFSPEPSSPRIVPTVDNAAPVCIVSPVAPPSPTSPPLATWSEPQGATPSTLTTTGATAPPPSVTRKQPTSALNPLPLLQRLINHLSISSSPTTPSLSASNSHHPLDTVLFQATFAPPPSNTSENEPDPNSEPPPPTNPPTPKRQSSPHSASTVATPSQPPPPASSPSASFSAFTATSLVSSSAMSYAAVQRPAPPPTPPS